MTLCGSKLGKSHKDERPHEDPGQALMQAPLEVHMGYVGHILSQIWILLLLDCICLVSWICIGLGKLLNQNEARVACCMMCHCAVKTAGFGNLPRLVWPQQSPLKERESRTECKPATPRTLHSQGPETDPYSDWDSAGWTADLSLVGLLSPSGGL